MNTTHYGSDAITIEKAHYEYLLKCEKRLRVLEEKEEHKCVECKTDIENPADFVYIEQCGDNKLYCGECAKDQDPCDDKMKCDDCHAKEEEWCCEDCGYEHNPEDKCPNDETSKHYIKWRKDDGGEDGHWDE